MLAGDATLVHESWHDVRLARSRRGLLAAARPAALVTTHFGGRGNKQGRQVRFPAESAMASTGSPGVSAGATITRPLGSTEG